MPRIQPLPIEALTSDQARIHEMIGKVRGGVVGGPFSIWLRCPVIAEAANQLGNSVRLHGKLDPALFELVILIVARHWSAPYEWQTHAKAAAAAGLAQEIIDAIRTHQVPSFSNSRERTIYEIVRELIETRDLSEVSYGRAINEFGSELLVEIVTIVGFYTLVAMVLKSFAVPAADAQDPFA